MANSRYGHGVTFLVNRLSSAAAFGVGIVLLVSPACYDGKEDDKKPAATEQPAPSSTTPAPTEIPDGGPPQVTNDAAVDAPPPFTPTQPVEVGTGATYQQLGTGSGVLILYGGYTAELAHSQAWATELVRASLANLTVGHVYAVKGPQEPDYASLEIGNTGIRAHMAKGIADAAPFIFVVAHSSGSYVAHELLQQMDAKSEDATLAKIVYANLDGGGDGFDQQLAGKMRRVSFVYANDTSLADGLSANAEFAIQQGTDFASANGASFEVKVTDSGCNSGAEWCLHDLVVTQKPHKADTYDLASDYTDFVNRPVTTAYIDALATYLK